jgi:hypothetical protein
VNTPDADREFVEYYKHHYFVPVISQVKYDCWLERSQLPGSPDPKPALRFNTQAFYSHYNPFNITMRARDNQAAPASLRILGMPNAFFSIPNSVELDFSVENPKDEGRNYNINKPEGYNSVLGLQGRGQSHVVGETLLGPGRGVFAAFEEDVESGGEADRGGYGTDIQDLTFESVYADYEVLNPPLPTSMNWLVDFHLWGQQFSHGIDNHPGGDKEVSQILFNPFAIEAVDAGKRSYNKSREFRPGKRVELDAATYNTNTVASFTMWLRSTTSEDPSIRPLVDANIRGMFFNPAWDSP